MTHVRLTAVVLCLIVSGRLAAAQPAELPELPEQLLAETTSPLDGERQSLLYWAPDTATQQPTPLFVFVHSWSSDYKQDNSKWMKEAVERGWIWLHPDFRGINQTPKACGSRFARQDVLDAMDFICQKYNVDRERVYLGGVSGGGHMSMLMAGHHPERFSAVSSWVGISDLADWYRFHLKDGVPQRYAKMVAASLSGVPGESPEIDAEYRDRSPLFHLHRVGDLPISIYAGVEDGHSGSVPITHALHAFNAIAAAHDHPRITGDEIHQLRNAKKLLRPQADDLMPDPGFERATLLRRSSGNAHVTIFDGGHESLAPAACDWLAKQRRATPMLRNPAGSQK